MSASKIARQQVIVARFVGSALSDDTTGFLTNLTEVDWSGAWPDIFRRVVEVGYVHPAVRTAFRDAWRGTESQTSGSAILSERMGWSLSEETQAAIELAIVRAPEAHPMIRGLRGARKARFPLPGRGKSGGGRTIYYVAVAPGVLFMMTAYPKNERDDLSPEQRKAILEAIASIKGVEP